MFPVYIQTVGIGTPKGPDADNVVVVPTASLEWEPPWDWYPCQLPQWGISAASEETPRAWFAGEPQGQELRVWENLVMAVGRKQRILSPLTEEIIQRVQKPVRMAILTTPG